MRALVLVGALVLGAATVTPGVAHATDPATHDKALDLFSKGREAYKASRFQESIDLIKQAYALEPAAVLLYNLAKAYEGLGDLEDAAKTYDQYLADEKDVPDRAAIEEKVRNFRKSIAEKERLAKERDEARALLQKKDAPEAPKAPARRPPSPVPWVFVGVGTAGLVVGGVLGGLALGKNADADVAPSQRDAAEAHDAATSMALGSTVALVAGGALTGGGLLWGIIDVVTRGPVTEADADKPKDDVSIRVGPTFVGLDVAF